MIRKISALAIAAAFIAVPAFAQTNNIGSCGWGSKLFEGDAGVAPQVLGATTNGTSGNQTFAISSATSGCTREATVTSNWKTAAYIDSNMNRLAKDMSVGQGESLDSLASLMGIEEGDKVVFFQAAQNGFDTIFPSEEVTADQVSASLNKVMASDSRLVKYVG